ncbi:MAG TPA: hypothetical protein VFV78_07815 [Vicinamibacterales bacterium]|nr:hypothetical protein [Vicinamibacterales bacterium]
MTRPLIPVAILACTTALLAATQTFQAAAPPQLLCGAPPAVTHSAHYRVHARVRPFLIWIGRRVVGAAQMNFELGSSQFRVQSSKFELTIGTDPATTPMHVNRWGHLREATCGARTTVVGVMTQSDETTIDEAQRAAPAGGGNAYRVVRSTIAGGTIESELLRLVLPDSTTYRDLAQVISGLPVPGAAKRVAATPGLATGFLSAMSELIGEAHAALRRDGRIATPMARRYVHGTTIYSVTIGRASLITAARIGDRVYSTLVDADYEIRNHTSGELTRFSLATQLDGAAAGLPARVVFRPRWWLELELIATTPAEDGRRP